MSRQNIKADFPGKNLEKLGEDPCGRGHGGHTCLKVRTYAKSVACEHGHDLSLSRIPLSKAASMPSFISQYKRKKRHIINNTTQYPTADTAGRCT